MDREGRTGPCPCGPRLGPKLVKHGLHRHRGPAGAENQGLFSGAVDSHPTDGLRKAPGVGVVAVQAPVGAAHQSVDAAEGAGQRGELVTAGCGGFFIRDGHIQPVPIAFSQKGLQLLRFPFIEPVFICAQPGVNGWGVTMGQLPAQKSTAQCGARGGRNATVLILPAQGEQAAEQSSGTVPQLWGELRQERFPLLFLPPGVPNGETSLGLIGGDFLHRFHSPLEQRHQFVVNFVDLLPKVLQIHGVSLPFLPAGKRHRWPLPQRLRRRELPEVQCRGRVGRKFAG